MSHTFDDEPTRCCTIRRNRTKIIVRDETARQVLERYHLKNLERTTRTRTRFPQPQKACNRGSINATINNSVDADESVLAEEGSLGENSENVCNICLGPYQIGEEVVWSKLQLGHCRHVFHYDCFLPWAVLGNVRCPVCREKFYSHNVNIRCRDRVVKFQKNVWSRIRKVHSKTAEKRRFEFCVVHGLVSPLETENA